MEKRYLVPTALAGLLVASSLTAAPTRADADAASTAAIAAAAGAVVGALLYDSSNHPYYVRDGHRYYLTSGEAQYYRAHHHGVMRSAYVPEREYPVARDPYHGNKGGHEAGGHRNDRGRR